MNDTEMAANVSAIDDRMVEHQAACKEADNSCSALRELLVEAFGLRGLPRQTGEDPQSSTWVKLITRGKRLSDDETIYTPEVRAVVGYSRVVDLRFVSCCGDEGGDVDEIAAIMARRVANAVEHTGGNVDADAVEDATRRCLIAAVRRAVARGRLIDTLDQIARDLGLGFGHSDGFINNTPMISVDNSAGLRVTNVGEGDAPGYRIESAGVALVALEAIVRACQDLDNARALMGLWCLRHLAPRVDAAHAEGGA